MGMIIFGGVGNNFPVGVSPTGNRLNVSSRSDGRMHYISRDNGDAYTTTSIDTTAADEYNFYFKNTSTTQKFYVSSITLGCAVLSIFKISTVTGIGAGASAIPIPNLNRLSGNTADATVLGNAAVTGLTEEAIIEVVSILADDSKTIKFYDAFILGQNDAFAVEYDVGAGGTMHCTMRGFFDIE